MNLRVRDADLQSIRAHGASTYPHECCGLLIGQYHPSGKTVLEVHPLDNERADSRHNRFLISPETILRADRDARARGLDVVGFYHSHPDAPAIPSEFDREQAWPTYSYVIVAIEAGRATDLRSWTLDDDRGHFNPEILDTLEVP